MLILTRRPGESIMIENNDSTGQENLENGNHAVSEAVNKSLITIKVLRVKGGQISLGIDAPPSIAIYREEIYQKKTQPEEGVEQHEDEGYISEYPDSSEYY